jgi:formamidopyrimidine-DNA glycosylase
MPEIIEVKMYSDFIRKNIKDNKLLSIKILNGRYKKHGPFEHYKKIINELPCIIEEINTKGKFMYMKFNDDLYLGVSLGLMGGWFFRKKDSNRLLHTHFMKSEETNEIIDGVSEYLDRASKHLNLEFHFQNGSLYYYDQLSFGSFIVYDKEKLDKKLRTLGVDIMDPNTTLESFVEKFKKPTNLKKKIGIVLLDQKVIAGIGNYLRADLLWLCRISPFRKVKDITDEDFELLFKNIRLLTWVFYDYEKAIKLKIINKKDKLPENYKVIPKEYTDKFLVYYRDEDYYGNKIVKEKLYEGNQIRYIYWVPKLQK